MFFVIVKVIPVVIGEEADPRELENTTPDKKNLIEADKGDGPRVVGEKIMEKIRGNCHFSKQKKRLLFDSWVREALNSTVQLHIFLVCT